MFPCFADQSKQGTTFRGISPPPRLAAFGGFAFGPSAVCCHTRRTGPHPAAAPPLARGASAGPLRGCAPRACPCGRRGPLPPLRSCGAPPIHANNNGKDFPRRRVILSPAVARVSAFSAHVGGCKVRHTGNSLPIRRPHIAGQCPASPSIPPMCYRAAPDARRAMFAPQAPEAGDVPRGGRHPSTPFPPSVFPLWKPPFQIPPSCGSRQRGQTAGGHGAASSTPTQRRPSG